MCISPKTDVFLSFWWTFRSKKLTKKLYLIIWWAICPNKRKLILITYKDTSWIPAVTAELITNYTTCLKAFMSMPHNICLNHFSLCFFMVLYFWNRSANWNAFVLKQTEIILYLQIPCIYSIFVLFYFNPQTTVEACKTICESFKWVCYLCTPARDFLVSFLAFVNNLEILPTG